MEFSALSGGLIGAFPKSAIFLFWLFDFPAPFPVDVLDHPDSDPLPEGLLYDCQVDACHCPAPLPSLPFFPFPLPFGSFPFPPPFESRGVDGVYVDQDHELHVFHDCAP